jgi:hypothetical protein
VRVRTASIAVASLSICGCHWGLIGVVVGSGNAQGPYIQNSLAAELGPTRVRTLGCLDVGIEPLGDRSDVVDVHMGNRCTHPEPIDLAKLGVTVRKHEYEGVARDAAVWDPRNEVIPLHVGGAERGRERIRIDGMSTAQRVCFSFGSIVPDAPDARPLPMCFRRGTGEWIFDGTDERPS